MKKFLRPSLLKLALFLLVCTLNSCLSSDGNTRVLKLAHVLNVNHPVHKGMVFLADKVAEKSGGRMRVDIYPSGQLGMERDLIELLQIGSLAMTKVSSAPLESFVPEMKIFGIPYVFRDEEHLWKVLNGEIGRKLLLAGQRYYLRGLCYYDAGSRSFYTKENPIHTPEDLFGLKIRVMKSNTSVRMVQALGGSATPIPWGELYTALQQGVVDGAENNPPSFYVSHHYEVCKYYTLDEHTVVPDVLLISTVIWEGLSDQEQKWLQESVNESVEYQRILWKQATEEALDEVRKAGVKIFRPDKTPFQDAVKVMHESYKGTDLYDLIRQIMEME
ncbi:TRAP transporter substrate-binding protein [Acidobacteriota bacterium]